MIRKDALTPAAADEYEYRLLAFTRSLSHATSRLSNAWNKRNAARWPGDSADIKDMRPVDDPGVLAAEAEIEEARDIWRAAQAALANFLTQPLNLRCGCRNWKPREFGICKLDSNHEGEHSFEVALEAR